MASPDSSRVQEIFQSADFNVYDFVEQTAAGAVPAESRDDSAASLKHRLDAFASAIKQVEAIRESTDQAIEQLEAKIQGEKAISLLQRTDELGNLSEDLQDNIDELGQRIHQVGGTAVRIAGKLEECNRQKERAEAAAEIIKYFDQFSPGKRLDSLFTDSDAQQTLKAARILRRLLSLSRELKMSGIETTAINIESYGEEFERRVMGKFEVASRKSSSSKYDEMKLCIDALAIYNGGEIIEKTYINQRKMFFDREYIDQLRRDDDNLAELAVAPSATPLRQQLAALYRRMVAEVEDEAMTIRKVFPNANKVVYQLVRRICDERLENLVDVVLRRAKNASRHNFVTALETTWTATAELVRMLVEKKLALKAELSRQIEEVFATFMDDYLATELELLMQHYVHHFDDVRVTSKNAAHAELHSHQVGIDIAKVESWIRYNLESIKRCESVSSATTHAENIQCIASVLLTAVRQYITAVFPSSAADDALLDGKQEPDLKVFEAVRTSTEAALLVIVHFEEKVLPSVARDISVQSKCSQSLLQLEIFVEDRSHDALTHLRDTIHARIEWILQTEQKKTDYKIGEDGITNDATRATTKVCKFLHNVKMLARESLHEQNRFRFLFELGRLLVHAIEEHMCRYVYTLYGGYQLMHDLNTYREVLDGFDVPSISEELTGLCARVQLLIVPVKNVSNVLHEDPLCDHDRRELIKLLHARSDFHTSVLAQQFGTADQAQLSGWRLS